MAVVVIIVIIGVNRSRAVRDRCTDDCARTIDIAVDVVAIGIGIGIGHILRCVIIATIETR